MFDKTQLMRGSLEGCVLKIIEHQTTYGYEILEQLHRYGFADVSEGTIYPILLRLEKMGNITSQLRTSPLGPKRKYYTISDAGREHLASFYACWNSVENSVHAIFREGEES